VQTRTPEFWSVIYIDGDPQWDMGGRAPPLVAALDGLRVPENGSALVPGRGFGHEAIYLGRQGWHVTAVDFAPEAVAQLRKRAAGFTVSAVQRDIFELERDFAEQFDLVVEHTCYCAIPPEMREEYVRTMAAVLREEGVFVGLFWEVDGEGPPYSSSREEIKNRFSRLFSIEQIARATDSFAERRGQEWLVRMKKPGGNDDAR
jgi:SAM-dependent methyltransferase